VLELILPHIMENKRVSWLNEVEIKKVAELKVTKKFAY
jgi:hypothetical protein